MVACSFAGKDGGGQAWGPGGLGPIELEYRWVVLTPKNTVSCVGIVCVQYVHSVDPAHKILMISLACVAYL